MVCFYAPFFNVAVAGNSQYFHLILRSWKNEDFGSWKTLELEGFGRMEDKLVPIEKETFFQGLADATYFDVYCYSPLSSRVLLSSITLILNRRCAVMVEFFPNEISGVTST